MSIDTNATVASRTISAFFDTAGAAKTAVDDLIAAGIPRQHISQTGGQAAEAQSANEGPHVGFWESLKDFFLPDEDRASYAEGLRRGGYLLAVQTDEANYNRVLDILDTDGAVNMDDRESSWRQEGWSANLRDAGPVLTASGPTSGVLPGVSPTGAANNNARFSTSAYDTAAATRGEATAAGRDATARAETLDTSVTAAAAAASARYRRDDAHGRSRLRSYVLDGDQEVGEGEVGEAPRGSFSPSTDRNKIVEHMEVISADGQSIGTVDHLDGPDRIKLTRNSSPDGQHHFVPFAWIDHVDQHVHLRKTLAEIKAQQ